MSQVKSQTGLKLLNLVDDLKNVQIKLLYINGAIANFDMKVF